MCHDQQGKVNHRHQGICHRDKQKVATVELAFILRQVLVVILIELRQAELQLFVILQKANKIKVAQGNKEHVEIERVKLR